MAVDYIHRLVVSGPALDVRAFRRAVSRTVDREAVGSIEAWREHVPLSFAAMYSLCPGLTRVEPNVPCDPYDLSIWPLRSLPHGCAEVRYQLHTRNLEMGEFIVALSRRFANLALVLVTFCLDGNSIDTYLFTNGRKRKATPSLDAHARQGLIGEGVGAGPERLAILDEQVGARTSDGSYEALGSKQARARQDARVASEVCRILAAAADEGVARLGPSLGQPAERLPCEDEDDAQLAITYAVIDDA